VTAAYDGDTCPACGSPDTQPFAVIVGAAETYGYQCLECATIWPVIQAGTLPDAWLPHGA
jgi:translation initiation factor 2 beta subunit (eIF-2beta)/eIF-5